MNGRLSSVTTFARIARENLKLFNALDAKRKALHASQVDPVDIQTKITHIEGEMGKLGVIIIVFAAMALEAYIYDYAARNLSDKYAKDHLDRLDTPSKWLIIPKLITGKEIEENSKAMELLKALVRARNEITHYKSQSIPLVSKRFSEFLGKYKNQRESFPAMVRDAVRTLDELAQAIHTIDPDEPASLYLG